MLNAQLSDFLFIYLCIVTSIIIFSLVQNVPCDTCLFFLIEVQLIYNILLVSNVQHNDSILCQIIVNLKLLQNNGCISPCCMLYFCCLFIYTQLFVSLNLPLHLPLLPSLFPLVTTVLFSISLSLFLFAIYICLFFRLHK